MPLVIPRRCWKSSLDLASTDRRLFIEAFLSSTTDQPCEAPAVYAHFSKLLREVMLVTLSPIRVPLGNNLLSLRRQRTRLLVLAKRHSTSL